MEDKRLIHKIKVGNKVSNVINHAHPQVNIARNTLLKGDFSSDYKSSTAEDKVMADFASMSYKKHRSHEYMNHILDRELSDKRHAIYYNKNHVVFANRGTADMRDVVTDLGIFAGHRGFDLTQRSKESKEKCYKL